MTFVATLIANPAEPALSVPLAEAMAQHAGARTVDWLAQGIACDIAIAEGRDPRAVAGAVAATLAGAPVDIVVQPVAGRRKRLLLADMDSTMIRQECVDELAAVAGIGDEVAAITARAMNGEIAFEPALRERVALLRDLPLSVIDEVIATRITLMPGGRELIATMKRHGAYTALVSGGFTAFASRIAETLGFDEHRANILEHADGRLTGRVTEPILGKQAKLETLEALSAGLGIAPEDAMAVGDGANDLAMLERAGSGVALHAKPSVAARARMRIDHGDLTALLYIQGYRHEDIAA